MQVGLRRTTIKSCVCILSSLLFYFICNCLYIVLLYTCIYLSLTFIQFKFAKRDHHSIHTPLPPLQGDYHRLDQPNFSNIHIYSFNEILLNIYYMLSIHCIMKYILHFIVLSMSLMRRCQLLLGCWVVLIISKIKINRIPTNKITIITLIAKLWHIHHSYI